MVVVTLSNSSTFACRAGRPTLSLRLPRMLGVMHSGFRQVSCYVGHRNELEECGI